MTNHWTEADIQALKAQEAKDLAVDLLRQLEAKERAPITAGQVQLKELQFTLRLKEAEAEDNRLREAHSQRIKELELDIEREKSKQAEAISHADQLRQEHARLVAQVQEMQESLSVQLERATREQKVQIESLHAEYGCRKAELDAELAQLEDQKTERLETIAELTELGDIAGDVAALREEIESRTATQQRELARLDEAFEAAEFEKKKGINQIKRNQEIELAELEAEHRKQVTARNLDAAHTILEAANMIAVSKADWESIQARDTENQRQDETGLAEARRKAEEELKRSYNITTSEVFDVTELFYREKAPLLKPAHYDNRSKNSNEKSRGCVSTSNRSQTESRRRSSQPRFRSKTELNRHAIDDNADRRGPYSLRPSGFHRTLEHPVLSLSNTLYSRTPCTLEHPMLSNTLCSLCPLCSLW